MSEWRPIETAPHGDNGVLGFDPDVGIDIIHWSEKCYRPGNKPWSPGWYSSGAFDSGIPFTPTHWYPLPDPPDASVEPKQ